ncbi:methylmalonyl-CoA epimerase [Halobacterium jilantaiense]|uniref:Methylmalonyl-CoA epimerase n=1 Tax=Halobacterium jilantaiense TaxID=355548 RepID=A0A1I0NRY2_9EURY|nr:methylmalonyl-CoA epimerase [Halobacterium jilantaiense]SEW03672.1 methylmalonyl-CoA epimerase [Halobacterium jilantaiense]
MHVDHVGVATEDAESLADLYTELLDAPVAHEEVFDGLRVVFLDLGGDGYVELLEPVDDDTTIGRYLENEGGGIHHVAFATDDIEAALETAREAGVGLIDEEPRDGAWGHDVAFLHPKDTGGALIEFVEH